MPADRVDGGAEAGRNLRIALLSPCFWPEVRRGTERIVNDLGRGLLARGHHPRVITSHPGLPSRAVEDGLEVIRNWRPPMGRLRRRHREDYLTHLPFTYCSLARGDDQIAHSFFPPDALAAARWASRTGRPTVMTYAGIPDRVGLVHRRHRLEMTVRAVRASKAVVAISEAAALAFNRWLGVEPEVIFPAVDTEAFSPGGERDPDPTIVFAGAVGEERKRVPLLIRAFELVRRKRPGAKLLLDRPPPDFADRFSAQTGVEFVDLSTQVELVATYRRAWASALPAIGEAFGLVLAEALACGTPGVGSRHGGIPEVLNSPAVGRTFDDAENEQGLARALLETLELAEDPATTEACVARAEQFSLERSVDSYERLYRRVLDRSG